MKRWLAVLGVLLAGALLLPQHAWSQGAVVNNGLVVNDGLQIQGTPLSIKFYDGTNTGTLQPATLTGNQTWTLPDASGTILLTGSAAGGDLTGTYPNPTIANDAVTSAKIADGTIVDADIASNAGIAVSKLAVAANNLIVGDGSGQGSLLAPGSPGQVLTIVGGAPQWADLPSITETDPVWTADKTGTTTISGTWTFTNPINGSISGNAATATALQTAQNFALSGDVTAPAVSFNGTAGVTLVTTIADDAVTSAKIADGTIVDADIASNAGIAVSKLAVAANNLIVGDGSGQGSLLAPGSPGQVLTIVGGAPQWADLPSITETDPVWTADKTGTTTISGTWTFTNPINGSISGNAATATALQTAQNFALSGDVTAPAVSFNGTAGVTLVTTIADDAVTSAKIADGTIVDADIASNAGIAVSKLAVAANNLIVGDGSGQGSLLAPGSPGQVLTIVGGAPQWADLPSITETDPVWTADKTGTTTISGTWTFTNPINGSISGNAATATALQTAQNFALSGDVTAPAVSFNGTAGVTLVTTIADDAVTSAKIADGTIVDADIASNAGIAVSKLAVAANNLIVGDGSGQGSLLAPGSPGQVLTIVGGAPQWADLPSITETDPVWTADKTGTTTISGTWTFTNPINGSISGNAATATALQTAQNFALSGDVTAPAVSFNGTAGVTLVTTIADDAVTSAKIADGTIVDADIASNAGIAVSKLAVAANNLIVGDGSGQGSLLAPGSNGQVLMIVGSTPTWASLSAAGGWAVGGNNLGGGGTGVLGTTSNDNLEVRTNNTLAMYIKASNQYVGIGTNDPQSRLHVHGSEVRVTNSTTGSTATDGFVVGLSGSDAELRQYENARILFNTNAAAGGDTVEAQLTSTGQLAFFTTGTPGFRVDLPNNSANAVGRIRAVGISFWSSMRWKEDIRPIPNALEKALALRGVNFRWKPEYGGGEDIGFIMEEVDRVVPEVVQRDERTGELLGMDYARLTALLVEALKEEHRRNEALRAEVAELRSLVEQLLRQNGERGTSSQPSTISTIQDAWLGQNIPNPFAGTTTIPYYIPAGVSRAELVVRDVGGRELRRLELAERGAHGQVVLEMGLMGSGTYEYALVLDGRVVAVKQMTLVR